VTRASFVFRFHKRWMEWMSLILLFAWACFLFTRYFSFNELPLLTRAFSIPDGFSPSPTQWTSAFVSFLKILGTSLAVAFTAFRVGYFLRTWARFNTPNRLLKWAFDLSFGIMALDGLWLALGFNQLWMVPFLRDCFGLLFLVCAVEKMIHFSLPSWKEISFPDWPYGLLAVVGLCYWLFSCWHGFLPETHTDGLNYHLGVPCNWLMRHGIGNFTSSYYDGYPYGGELFLFTGYLFQGAEAAKLLNALVFGVCALAAAGWAQDSGEKNAGWLAFGLTLTTPLLALVGWTTQVESFLVLFSVLFFYGLYRLVKTDQFKTFGPDILLTGLCGGMVLSVKYTGVLGVGIGLLLFPFFFKDKKRFSRKNYLILCLLIAGVDAVWLLKNWTYLADPFSPYLKNLFHAGPASWWDKDLEDVNPDPLRWYRSIWSLGMAKPSLFGFAGPLILILMPAVLFFKTNYREWKWAGWSLAVLCPVCLMFLTILKFHLPEIIFFYVFCSVLFAGQENRAWGRSIALIALVSAILCFPYLSGMSAYYYSGWPLWSFQETRDQYLERRLPFYESCEYVSRNLSPDAKLLLMGAQDVYYDRLSDADWGFFERLFQTAGSLDEVLLKMREAGYTHVVINVAKLSEGKSYLTFTLSPAQWRLFDEYFRRGLNPVYQKGPVAIFSIRPQLLPKGNPSPVDPFLFCSEPASQFLIAEKEGDLKQAQFYLNQAVQLYPFSDYWKNQEKRLRNKKAAHPLSAP
jgi:hypothetical protein